VAAFRKPAKPKRDAKKKANLARCMFFGADQVWLRLVEAESDESTRDAGEIGSWGRDDCEADW
jgi:hypothetical protein